jgi:SAM-dependent methyltransferase
VVDASPDALATLRRRAVEVGVADRVSAICCDVDGLAGELPPTGYDLVLCHQLLEVVDDPAKTLATVAGAVRPGGCASLLVASRAATVLSRALGGHPADALRAFTDPAGRWSDTDSALRRFDTAEVSALVAGAGLTVETVHGVRVVADLLPGALQATPGVADALRDLELALAALPPYRDIATQLHLLARR